MDVLPVINCHYRDHETVTRKLRTAETFAEWVHLDVADSAFTFNRSFDEPEVWKSLSPRVKTEVHLMVEEPQHVAEAWLKAGAKRIIIHCEAISDPSVPATVFALARNYGADVMLAINPETSLEAAERYLPHFNAFQVFSQAHPGPSGQPFLPVVLSKIKTLRARFPKARIEIDGGVVQETARQAKEAGADTVVSGSYIFGAPDPRAAYQELKEV